MKTYVKPNTKIVGVESDDFYALPGGTGQGTGELTKRNDGWEFDDEDEDGGLW
ncbi:MAG: hypothetical protein LUC49_03050 [Prevotella sp.]|nr:hypothetical protein [Prevotella sp.]